MHNILQDSPICEEAQDEFGRVPLVELIANSIIAFSKDNHSCTNIGLYGTWGCGKTSMINLLRKRLKDNGKSDKIVMAHFNPWQAGSEEVLMIDFFKSICCDFEGNVRSFIKKYGDFISLASRAVPVVGEAVSSGINGIRTAFASNEKTLKEQKDRISKAIVKSGKHLLVFIDDLDRLDKEELHAVFRLIRQVADFDNTIYVVAMDVDMASKSIAQYYGGSSIEDGRRFIDKIIQVPISLPVISKTVLSSCLEQSLRKKILYNTKLELDDEELGLIVESVVDLFETKRDCIRYINQLGFILPSVVYEVNVYDFCVLEAIKTISQEVYFSILHNKNALLKLTDGVGAPVLDKEKLREYLENRFKEAIEDITKHITVHNLGRKIKVLLEDDLFCFNGIDEFDLIDHQRLQSRIYFDKYFVMTVPENLIPDIEIYKLKDRLCSMDYHALSDWINRNNHRFGFGEIQRATLRIIRMFDADERCKYVKLFCEALSISELAQGYDYNTHLFNHERTDVFVTSVLISRYMVGYQELKVGMENDVDSCVLDETLATIYHEADFVYCMYVHNGLFNLLRNKMSQMVSSFNALKMRFKSIDFDEQMKFYYEILVSFYRFWKNTDVEEMKDYLLSQMKKKQFNCEAFIEKFISQGYDNSLVDFVNLFQDIVPQLANKINNSGINYEKDSTVRMFLNNYKILIYNK